MPCLNDVRQPDKQLAHLGQQQRGSSEDRENYEHDMVPAHDHAPDESPRERLGVTRSSHV